MIAKYLDDGEKVWFYNTLYPQFKYLQSWMLDDEFTLYTIVAFCVKVGFELSSRVVLRVHVTTLYYPPFPPKFELEIRLTTINHSSDFSPQPQDHNHKKLKEKKK
jgi:hypothetical protein